MFYDLNDETVIGISANGLEEHHKWVADIESYGGKVTGPTNVAFPIVREICLASLAIDLQSFS